MSTIAQAALGQDSYVRESLALIETEKAWLEAALAGLGATVIGNAANYLFFLMQEAGLREKLERSGIMIRDCSNFCGLGQGYYRVAVLKRDENERLIDAMQTVLAREWAD